MYMYYVYIFFCFFEYLMLLLNVVQICAGFGVFLMRGICHLFTWHAWEHVVSQKEKNFFFCIFSPFADQCGGIKKQSSAHTTYVLHMVFQYVIYVCFFHRLFLYAFSICVLYMLFLYVISIGAGFSAFWCVGFVTFLLDMHGFWHVVQKYLIKEVVAVAAVVVVSGGTLEYFSSRSTFSVFCLSTFPQKPKLQSFSKLSFCEGKLKCWAASCALHCSAKKKQKNAQQTNT